MKTEQREMDHEVFDEEPAEVGFAVGRTINLGAYESVRIDVSVKVPCRLDRVEESYVSWSNWVKGKLREESQKVVDYANRERKTRNEF